MTLETKDVCEGYEEMKEFLFNECEQITPPENKERKDLVISDLATSGKPILAYFSLWAGGHLSII